MAPFAKTGGLADVAGSLPIALEEEGMEMAVVTPAYHTTSRKENPATIGKKTKVYFIEHRSYFSREGLYGDRFGDYLDNLERFSYFCRQSLELLKEIRFKPDLIHCHDWQTALIPVYLKTLYRTDSFFNRTKAILTIHNMAYQGVFPGGEFSKIGIGPEWFTVEGLEFFGKVNLLKGGIQFADVVTTVSPTYAKEIQTPEYGCGLEGVLIARERQVIGILNGLNHQQWNPEKDPCIIKNYSVATLDKKIENKLNLQKNGGLSVDKEIPLIAMISRLVDQKGFDLVAEIIEDLCLKLGQLVLLGTGGHVYHQLFERVQKKFCNRAAIYLKFDAALAQKIYAGADFFLIPSRYEPCGLGQMIALRYGTIPIVRKTGGLADTVKDFEQTPLGNGFVFEEYSSKALYQAVERGIKAFQDKQRWKKLVQRAMGCDFSWKNSAREYISLYKLIIARNSSWSSE